MDEKKTFPIKISVSHPVREEGKTEYVSRNTLTRNAFQKTKQVR